LKDAYPVWAGGRWKRTRHSGHLASGLPVLNASTEPDDKPLYMDGRMLVVWLGLFTDGATLRAEVWDQAPGAPARRTTGTDDVSGRGLDLVVDALSADWGWFPAQSGKCAWAEFHL
jgi:hypothetical protein